MSFYFTAREIVCRIRVRHSFQGVRMLISLGEADEMKKTVSQGNEHQDDDDDDSTVIDSFFHPSQLIYFFHFSLNQNPYSTPSIDWSNGMNTKSHHTQKDSFVSVTLRRGRRRMRRTRRNSLNNNKNKI